MEIEKRNKKRNKRNQKKEYGYLIKRKEKKRRKHKIRLSKVNRTMGNGKMK